MTDWRPGQTLKMIVKILFCILYIKDSILYIDQGMGIEVKSVGYSQAIQRLARGS